MRGDLPERKRIEAAITEKYAAISRTAIGQFAYPTGQEGARILGYDASLFADIPAEMMNSFCGVGNPFLAGPIASGETVLDVGCGSGIDLIVAARMAGTTGRICGIDLTPEMAALARHNASTVGLAHVEVRVAPVETIPHDDRTFDVVISNGVLNLSTRKDDAFGEIFRVLVPGGRLQFCDIVLDGDQPRETPCTLEAWSD